jgi:WD40 repeat protein
MAFCSCGDDKKIKIFAKDLSEMQRAMSLQQAQKKVSLLTLSLSQTRPQSVQPYEEWQCVLTLSGHNSYVMRVLHIDNRLISCSTDGTLKVWDFT